MTRISSQQFYDRAFLDIGRNQGEIARLQAGIGTGKRILKPSDDPSGAARARDLEEALARIEQYGKNAVLAEQRLSLQDSTLEGVQNLLVRVKELSLQANSGVQTPETRNAIATEVSERLSELLEIANTRDAAGDYLFSGFRSDVRPFERLGGAVVYNGDQGTRELQVSATRRITAGDHGARVFLRVPGGNGEFSVSAAPANTGTAVTAPGSVSDASAATDHDYSIRFTGPATFDVVDDTLGATVLAAQPYTPGEAITFDGITTSGSGQPAAGDRFDIAPAVAQSPFQTLQALVDVLAVNPADGAAQARVNQDMNHVIDSLDQAVDHVLEVRAVTGSRLNALETVSIEHEDLALELETSLSSIQDLDMTRAIGTLQQRIASLEAAQQSFVSLARLSLFDFLR